jgi:DNA-binding transcriptional ArsR family regulator
MSPPPDRVGAVFAALSDPTRRQVVQCLAEAPATATELAGRFPISRQAVSKHLSLLDEAGLVTAERAGRELRFQLTPAAFADAMTWMADVGAQWDTRLQALKRHLSSRR